ncbi:hypothetical protein EGA31_14510 [Mycobacterium avium subsp. paratuberculosis]|nr:hypothetical protein EGA31_14510 [Mycobacterium avium subsp. paratuberculosis]
MGTSAQVSEALALSRRGPGAGPLGLFPAERETNFTLGAERETNFTLAGERRSPGRDARRGSGGAATRRA